MFQREVMDKVTRLSTNHNLFEQKGEPKRYRTEVLPPYQPNALPNALPLGQTGSLHHRSSTTALSSLC